MTTATAQAHPNIALVKYWGKQPGPDNLPATASLSITLDTLTTNTSVQPAKTDALEMDGRRREDHKVTAFLAQLRTQFDIPPLAIETRNNFPTGSGLASSASGFAALITAIDRACALGLTDTERSIWARRGSGSAARSIFGGFVTLSPEASESASTATVPRTPGSLPSAEYVAKPIASAAAWPLAVVVCITSFAAKSVSSTLGMERSRLTSPYFDAWTQSTNDDFQAACEAVRQRDFTSIATIAEASCLKMHALMLSSHPSLLYWNAGTLNVMQSVRAMREEGLALFFTIDAGPQVKIVCLPADAAQIAERAGKLDGVERTLIAGLGLGARVL